MGAYATIVRQDFVWQILIHLLNERGETTDKAVQLSAALAIKKCVDVSYRWMKSTLTSQLYDVDMSFFVPHAQPVAAGL